MALPGVADVCHMRGLHLSAYAWSEQVAKGHSYTAEGLLGGPAGKMPTAGWQIPLKG